MKRCPWCEVCKPAEGFTYERSRCDDCERERARQWHRDNKDRSRQNAADWKAANPERNAATERRAKLLKNYGVTPEQYDGMLMEQGFSCAICRKHQSLFTKRLAVDHDHETGKVRGLLCANCNKGIGNLQEDAAILSAAITYLGTAS